MSKPDTDYTPPSWLGLEAPRYTSYPSAHHFSGSVTAQTYANWLESVQPDTTLSVYVHIPFCRELCWFCGCHTKMTYRNEPVAKYVRVLLQEIELIKERLNGNGRLVNVHFGGGSPSLLEPGDLQSILYGIADMCGMMPEGEVAIELDPRTSTPENIQLYGKLGFNRASIGIQDFDEKVQKAVNRIQPYPLVASVMEQLRAVGLPEINTDLIYGLPHQTRDSFIQTLEKLVTLDPARVALFSYAHVPHLKKHQRLIPEDALPADAEKLELYMLAREFLAGHGYVTIGIDHFAKATDKLAVATAQKTLRRNFQGYVVDTTNALIGLGSSAISQFPQGYAQNTPQSNLYRDMIARQELPTVRGWTTQSEDGLRKAVIDELMCYMSADLGAIRKCYGLPEGFFGKEIAELSQPEYADSVAIDGEVLQLTTPYRMAVRAVASVFDAYRPITTGKYSKVV